MRVVSPLLTAVGLIRDNLGCMYPISRDAAALHVTVFAMQSFVDRILRRQEKCTNPAAMLHFEKGVRLLRKRFLSDDDAAKTTDSTISVVLKLAGAAHFDGDRAAAQKHMEGLRRMVDLRGGLDVFADTMLRAEMLR